MTHSMLHDSAALQIEADLDAMRVDADAAGELRDRSSSRPGLVSHPSLGSTKRGSDRAAGTFDSTMFPPGYTW